MQSVRIILVYTPYRNHFTKLGEMFMELVLHQQRNIQILNLLGGEKDFNIWELR